MEYRALPEYKELLELKKMKKQKIQEIHVENALAQHRGYKVGLALPPECGPVPSVRLCTRVCAWVLLRVCVSPHGRSELSPQRA